VIQFVGISKRSIKPPVWAVILLTVFLLLLIATFLAGRFSAPRADQGGGVKVSVNSTGGEKKKADLVITERLSGHGQSFIPAPKRQDESSASSVPTTHWFAPGDTLSQPLAGEVKASFIESGSGMPIGEGFFPVRGTTTATFTESGLQIDTVFTGEPEIAVTLPEPVRKRFEVGVLAGIDTAGQAFVGGYGRVNLTTWRMGGVEISPWVGAAGLRDEDGCEGYLLAGVSGRL
jgi:hypothetical protein